MSYRFGRVQNNEMVNRPKKTKRKRTEAVEWLAKDYKFLIPSRRLSTWSRYEAIVWIAFESTQAPLEVRSAARDPERAQTNPLSLMVMDWAIASAYEKSPSEIGTIVAEASAKFDAAVSAGELSLNENGKARVTEVKQLWPAKEGKGRGWSGYRHYEPDVIERLIKIFRSEPRGTTQPEDLRRRVFKRNKYEVYEDKDIGKSRLPGAAQHALTLAEKYIASDERVYRYIQKYGHPDPKHSPTLRGISPDEAAKQRANVKTWRKMKFGPILGKSQRTK